MSDGLFAVFVILLIVVPGGLVGLLLHASIERNLGKTERQHGAGDLREGDR